MITACSGSETDPRREVLDSISYRHQNVKQANRAGALHPTISRFTACQASPQIAQRAQFVGDLGIDPTTALRCARGLDAPVECRFASATALDSQL
jgi:hypothetical protein